MYNGVIPVLLVHCNSVVAKDSDQDSHGMKGVYYLYLSTMNKDVNGVLLLCIRSYDCILFCSERARPESPKRRDDSDDG